MLRSWLLGKTGRNAGTGIKGRSGHDARRLSLEPLEDRSLLSVSLLPIAPPVGIGLGGGPADRRGAGTDRGGRDAIQTVVAVERPGRSGRAGDRNGPDWEKFPPSATPERSTLARLTAVDVFPATVTFQNGFATFRVTFATANTPDTLTITDSKTATLTGEVLVNVGAQAVATKYDIDLVSSTRRRGLHPPSWARRGDIADLASNVVAVIRPRDRYRVGFPERPGHDLRGYGERGDLRYGHRRTAPSTVTFADGSVRFDVTFVTPGAQSVTVSDQTNTPALTGTLNVT